jgi:hypothetical protein
LSLNEHGRLAFIQTDETTMGMSVALDQLLELRTSLVRRLDELAVNDRTPVRKGVVLDGLLATEGLVALARETGHSVAPGVRPRAAALLFEGETAG